MPASGSGRPLSPVASYVPRPYLHRARQHKVFSARAAPLEAGAVVTSRNAVLDLLAPLAGVPLIAPPITSGRLPTLAEHFILAVRDTVL